MHFMQVMHTKAALAQTGPRTYGLLPTQTNQIAKEPGKLNSLRLHPMEPMY